MVLTHLLCYTLFGSPELGIPFGQRTAISFNAAEQVSKVFEAGITAIERAALQVSERVLIG